MIIAELCDLHGSYGIYQNLQNDAASVRAFLIAYGYKQVYGDSINSVFVYG